MQSFNPYLLIAPIGMAFLGGALLIAWTFDRRQRALLGLGISIVLISVALSVQSVLPAARIATYAVYTGVLYLAGAWLMGQSIAHKFRAPYPLTLAALTALATLWGLYYFSQVQENLGIRVVILSTGLSALQILPFARGIRRYIPPDKLDALLYGTYLFFCVYTLLRPLALLALNHIPMAALVQSVYWFVTLLSSILFCMVLACLMLASSTRGVFRRLNRERNLDPLTSLLNRRAFYEAAAQYFAEHDHTPTSVLMCDIDFFKKINDGWGHTYGDQVLRDVAECLRASTRQHDLVARFGGEEFVLLLPRTDSATAHGIAQRIQNHLAQARYAQPNHEHLTLSVGITTLGPQEPVDAAIERADRQLYHAKQAGRNCIHLG